MTKGYIGGMIIAFSISFLLFLVLSGLFNFSSRQDDFCSFRYGEGYTYTCEVDFLPKVCYCVMPYKGHYQWFAFHESEYDLWKADDLDLETLWSPNGD